MPLINSQLDQGGHALVNLVLSTPAPRQQSLQAAGVSLAPGQQATGLIDTGATLTAIDPRLRQVLNLTPFRLLNAAMPSSPGPRRVWCHKVDLAIWHPSGGALSLVCGLRSVVEVSLTHLGHDVLIGCDVLSRCVYTHNGLAGAFSLAY